MPMSTPSISPLGAYDCKGVDMVDLCRKVTPTCAEKLHLSHRFGMLPDDVMDRRDISFACKVIFACLRMESYGTGRVAISHAALAVVCGAARRTVIACQAALCVSGLIAKDGPPVDQIQPYLILYPESGARSAGAPKRLHRAKAPAHAKRELIRCPRCRTLCRQLLKAGYCRSCAWVEKSERISERVSERVSRRVFREERQVEKSLDPTERDA